MGDSREGRGSQCADPDASATTRPEVPDGESGETGAISAPPDGLNTTAAGLDRPRPSVSYREPVAWPGPPADGFTADP
jgi:hypothetical protein